MRPETAEKILKKGKHILVAVDYFKEEEKKEERRRLQLLKKEVK